MGWQSKELSSVELCTNFVNDKRQINGKTRLQPKVDDAHLLTDVNPY